MNGLERYALAAAVAATPAAALEPLQCDRPVHVHAVETGHKDLGEGLVYWEWRWTNEGVADDLHLMDCASGTTLVARARAERMTNPIPYDRRSRARARIERDTRHRLFFRFEATAAALEKIGVPTTQTQAADEPCACAAFYPSLRGDKTAFGTSP